MTDDLVARLRHEHELCVVMGDTKAGAMCSAAADAIEAERAEKDALHAGLSAIIHCQSALRRSEMREAAAGLLDKVGLKPMWFDGDQSPFVRRALVAEARVRELEAERDKWDRRVAYDELQAREHENRATQQRQIGALTIRAEAVERRLAEAYERAAKVAEEMPNMIAIGPKHVRGLRGSDVATAIRNLAQEVKHEAE